eukprot:9145851-Pyramimonas_sp.AAC.1
MADFDDPYSQINIQKLNTRRLVSEPGVYVSEDMMTVVARHVDDGMVIGEGKGPDDFLEALVIGEGKGPDMTGGCSQVHLGRIIRKLNSEMGCSIRVSPKTID